MGKNLVILGALLLCLNSSCINIKASTTIKKPNAQIIKYEYVKLEKYKMKIKLISGLGAISNSKNGTISLVDKNGIEKGEIYLVGYYGNQPYGSSGLPNHSSILSKSKINTPIGEGIVYTLERDMPHDPTNKTWNEIHAIIPIKKRQLAFDFWLKSSAGKINVDKQLLAKILNNTTIVS